MNLLVDVGNSRLKWAIETDGLIGAVEALDYRQDQFYSDLRERWHVIEPPKKLAIASVSNQQVLKNIAEIGQELWSGLELVVPQSTGYAYGVKNSYAQPEKLGIDRWLALIAAHNHYQDDVCVVDCGTAITVDAMRADGTHLGGLICPGLTTMQKALASNTAALTFNTLACLDNLAASTQAAIANGVLMAALGLIERVVRQLGSGYQLILTGGDADIIEQFLFMTRLVDDHLVLKGLSICCVGDPLL